MQAQFGNHIQLDFGELKPPAPPSRAELSVHHSTPAKDDLFRVESTLGNPNEPTRVEHQASHTTSLRKERSLQTKRDSTLRRISVITVAFFGVCSSWLQQPIRVLRPMPSGPFFVF